MKRICKNCQSRLTRGVKVCPYCGTVDPLSGDKDSETPRTVEALKSFAQNQPVPVKKLRCFIGEDSSEPLAFGIFSEGDRFTVFKNKAVGSREIVYRGKNEAEAVEKVYQRLQKELLIRRSAQVGVSLHEFDKNTKRSTNYKKVLASAGTLLCAAAVVVLGVFSIVSLFSPKTPKAGYYNYNGSYYYSQNGNWYLYDVNEGWVDVIPDDKLKNNSSKYFNDSSYSEDYDIKDFRDSEYYIPDLGDHQGNGDVDIVPSSEPEIDGDW